MTDLVVHPQAGGLLGTVAVPSDKSIGHRALLLAAIARGTSRIQGFSRGGDNLSTLAGLRRLGVRIDEVGATELRVTGVGLTGLAPPDAPIDCGNSGTTMRLMAGLLAGQAFTTVLVGDASLSRRPMMRVVDPLRRRGASVEGTLHGGGPELTAPLTIAPPSGRLGALSYDLPVSSAQVKSALLLSGLAADGPTVLREPALSRDHTERMLVAMGAPLAILDAGLTLEPGGWDARLEPLDLEIPGDISAAAFLLVAAFVVPGSSVTLRGVGLNPTRTGLLDIARDMAAPLTAEVGGNRAGEPVGDIAAVSGPLLAAQVRGDRVGRAIDEVCVLCALAARAVGVTRIEDAAELRVKESDRLAAMARVLRAFGVPCDELADGLLVEGVRRPLRAAVVDSGGDHRVAMTAAILGLTADGPSRIRDVDCIATSFPDFVGTLRTLGARLHTD
jgi:3-phosphoshikimate 1-carboxyvinyltransferase